ncbi:MAG: sulfatase-like hydrolase/transferase [Opitutales bacterium]|nr:sulfatase-like hydrolase/transferase [Opitutales bacterium]
MKISSLSVLAILLLQLVFQVEVYAAKSDIRLQVADQKKSEIQKPNILFIMIDDLGKDWVSCYGADDIKTPNIDSLATGGMKFHNAYSMGSCSPSRTTLLTGKYPFRTGWVSHWDVPRWGVGYFDWKKKGNTSFARLMKELGYATAVAGKWQINDFRVEPIALKKHGFDDWALWTGFETGTPPSDKRYKDPYINTPEDGSRTYDGKFGPDIYTERLLKFMRTHKDEPMCLYYPMPLLHRPFVPTPDEPHAKGTLNRHKAMVRYVDKMVGQLVDELDELGIRERTIIFFASDNGTDVLINGSLNGKKVKGGKGTQNEAGVCGPFIVNCPGTVPAGVETDALTDLSDMLPTFVELGGGKLPEDLIVDGKSMAPLILEREKDSARDWIMALSFGKARLDKLGILPGQTFGPRVIRDKQFKVWVDQKKQITRLHNLKKDPAEEKNLLSSKQREHRRAITKFQEIVKTFPKTDGRPLYEARAANSWDRK